MLFEKIKENPQACERLMETFYDALGVGDDYEGNGLSAEQFATALFRSYEEKDLTAFLMAICQNSMFDLLRNSFLAPFRFMPMVRQIPKPPGNRVHESGRSHPDDHGAVRPSWFSLRLKIHR